MPHDRHGKPLAEGDVVTMTFEVAELHQSETGCNATLRVVRPVGFDEPYLPSLACNSRLATKVDATPRVSP